MWPASSSSTVTGLLRDQPVPRDDPGRGRNDREHDERGDRPGMGGGALRRDRERIALRPAAGLRDDCEGEPDEEPEAEPAEVAPHRGPERDPSPAAVREEVDGHREEGDQRGDEHELDGPAPDDARPEVEVGRAAAGHLETLVDRADQGLRGRAQLRVARVREQPLQPRLAVELSGLGRVALGRDRERGDTSPDERRLLVEAVREGEVEQLTRCARPKRQPAGLLRDPLRGSAHECPAGGARAISRELEASRPGAGDGVEVDHRVDFLGLRPLRSAPRRSRRARRRRSRGRRACAPGPGAGPRPSRGSRTSARARSALRCPTRCRSHRGRSRGRRDGPSRRSGDPTDRGSSPRGSPSGAPRSRARRR